jgi:hypothetical protein
MLSADLDRNKLERPACLLFAALGEPDLDAGCERDMHGCM